MDKQSTAHIVKALKTVGDLISLANNSDVLRDDKVCGILLGVMQHCACKIHRHAEREKQAQALKAKSRGRQRVLELQQEQRRNLNKSIMILGSADSGCHRRRQTG